MDDADKSPAEKVYGCFITSIVAMVFLSVLNAFLGWMFMLLLGALHHEVTASFPPLGYWLSTMLTGLMMLTFVIIASMSLVIKFFAT